MQLQNRKVVIIGAGHVGSHAGFTLIAQGLVDEIVYIDVDEKKALAQALDLADSTAYLSSRAKVRVGTYADAADAPLMIVAAGPLPDLASGQTRMDTLRQTIAIMKAVTENIQSSGFSGIIVNICSHPPVGASSPPAPPWTPPACAGPCPRPPGWTRSPSWPMPWGSTGRARWSPGPP